MVLMVGVLQGVNRKKKVAHGTPVLLMMRRRSRMTRMIEAPHHHLEELYCCLPWTSQRTIMVQGITSSARCDHLAGGGQGWGTVGIVKGLDGAS